MSVYPAPPSYDEVNGNNTIRCNTCGNPCDKDHLYCFQCGQAIVKSTSSSSTNPTVIENPYVAPPPPHHQVPVAPPQLHHQVPVAPPQHHHHQASAPPPQHHHQPPAPPQQHQQAPPYPVYSQPPPAYQAHAPPQSKVHPLPPVVTTQPTHNVDPVYNSVNDMSVRLGDRLVYDFEKIACCVGQFSGLDPKVKSNIHPEINSKGITLEEWREWMIDLDVVQNKASSVAGCLCIFCFPGGLIQSILCAMFCPISSDHALSWLPCCYGDWYAALRQWTDKVNRHLNELGMHAKLLTYKPFQSAPRSRLYNQRIVGKDHNYEMSFLAIALTPQESRKLADESWDHGVNDNCTSGKGRCL